IPSTLNEVRHLLHILIIEPGRRCPEVQSTPGSSAHSNVDRWSELDPGTPTHGETAAAVGSRAARRAAARAAGVSGVDALLGEGWLQRAVAQVRDNGGRLTGPDSLLGQVVKEVLEAGLEAELTEHLGYARHDPAGHHSGNSRNGTTPKTV